MYYDSGTVALADAAEVDSFVAVHLRNAEFKIRTVTGSTDTLTASRVDDQGRLHVGLGFIDNGSTVDIQYRAFSYFDTNLASPTDTDRKNASGSVTTHTWALDTTLSYAYYVSANENYFTLVLTPEVGGDSKILYLAHADVVPSHYAVTQDEALANGSTSITIDTGSQRRLWNRDNIDAAIDTKHSVMLVEEGGDGNMELVEVSSVSGDTLTISSVANDYEKYRVGDWPLRTIVWAHDGSGDFGDTLPIVWVPFAAWMTGAHTLITVNAEDLEAGEAAPDQSMVLHGISKIGIMDVQERSEGSLPGVAVTSDDVVVLGESVFTIDDTTDLYETEWVAAAQLNDLHYLVRKY